MAKYFTIRCFIDCDEEEQLEIRKLVTQLGGENKLGVDCERARLYREGWCFRDKVMNWMQHAFYGGSVRSDGKSLVMEDIARIAKELPEIEGMIVIDDDEGDFHEEWDIANGQLTARARPTVD